MTLPKKSIRKLSELAKASGQKRLTAQEREAVKFLALSVKEWEDYQRDLVDKVHRKVGRRKAGKKQLLSLHHIAA